MPRRREVPKRKILPDPKFGDRVVAKFTNTVMEGGKKSIAERIVYDAFDLIGQRGTGEEPLRIFKKALDKLTGVYRSRTSSGMQWLGIKPVNIEGICGTVLSATE
mgnify:CR=1 FL=1